MDRNSQNYSAIKTPIPKGARLPQIVVQMPVYKESLEEVIKLTYYNVRRAMDYYTKHGGRVKFIVCDDGLQVRHRITVRLQTLSNDFANHLSLGL